MKREGVWQYVGLWPPAAPRGRGEEVVHKGDVGDGQSQRLYAG